MALRCDHHRHAIVEPDHGIIEVHCRKCSKDAGRPVYHRWSMQGGAVKGADGEDVV